MVSGERRTNLSLTNDTRHEIVEDRDIVTRQAMSRYLCNKRTNMRIDQYVYTEKASRLAFNAPKPDDGRCFGLFFKCSSTSPSGILRRDSAQSDLHKIVIKYFNVFNAFEITRHIL